MKILSESEFSRALTLLEHKNRIRIFVTIVLQMVISFLDLVGVLLIGLVGTLAVNGLGASEKSTRIEKVLEILNLQNTSFQKQVALLGILAAILLTLKTIVSLVITKRTIFFLSKLAATMSKDLISRLLMKNLSTIQRRSVQNIIYATTQGVSAITVGIIGTATSLIADVSLLIILGFGLFLVDSELAFLTLLLFSCVGYVLHFMMSVKVKKLGKMQSILSIKSQERISELILAFREITIGGRKSFYANSIGTLRKELSNSQAQLSYYRNFSKYILELTLVFGALAVAAFQFTTQTASHAVGVLSVFLAASARIGPAVLRVQQGVLGIKSSVGNAKPTYEIVRELSEIQPVDWNIVPFSRNHEDFNGSIDIRNVSFKYENSQEWAIKDLSLNVSSGEVVGIVGTSGAGKSTLTDLIIGALEPDFGEIRISGLKPRDAVIKWPGAMSYVPQEVVITNGTIKSNVALGIEDFEGIEFYVEEVLKMAQLKEMLSSLEGGLYEKVGDRGTKLSGGQRQRLGIARALFTDPKILLLDEATSSLDGITELNISNDINRFKVTKTIVIIAHRLSTIKNVDRIVYLEKGKIKSIGSFEEVKHNVPEFERQAEIMGL